MTGALAVGSRPGLPLPEQHGQLDHVHQLDDDQRPLQRGTQPVSNRLVLTLTGGSASVVSAGGNPADNSNGDIQRLFQITSGSSFTVRADVQASDCVPRRSATPDRPSTIRPHTPATGTIDFSKVDVGFLLLRLRRRRASTARKPCDAGVSQRHRRLVLHRAPARSAPPAQICRPGAGAPCDSSEMCTGCERALPAVTTP